MLHLQTPLAQAVLQLFDRALPLLAGQRSGTVKIYVFGGCALHMLTNARGSADIDAEIQASEHLLRDEIRAVYAAPEDYDARAIPLPGQESSPLQVFIAHPIDLAISKLGRFTERDQDDINLLIRSGKLNLKEFDRLAKEAIDYYPCDRSTVTSCLRLILDEAREWGQ